MSPVEQYPAHGTPAVHLEPVIEPAIEQERERVPGRTIVLITVTTIAITAALVVLAWEIANRGTDRRDAGYAKPRIPVPREVNQIETTLFPDAPGLDKRARQHEHLRRYGWVDRERGMIYIPIDRAARLYLERRASRATHTTPPGPPARGATELLQPPRSRRNEESKR